MEVASDLNRSPSIKTLLSLHRLSISFESVDTAKKKLPVHTLDGLTLSYKVKCSELILQWF